MTLKTLPDNVNNNNYNAILGTKSEDWSYEKEHRLHIPLENKIVIREGENYFMPFQVMTDNTFMLNRIFIGYRCRLGIENIKHDVKDYRHEVEVIQTRPAFKSFEVIEQKEKQFWNMKEGEEGKEHLLPSVKAAFGD